jgi:multidrug efflux pump subunit AcrA (membrane-fusion protein)
MGRRWFSEGSGRSATLTATVLVATLAVSGCSDKALGAGEPEPPATLIEDAGGGVPQIVLSERAEERLGIATAPVSGTPEALLVPYDAVRYDADGGTWVYTIPASHTYERRAITVNSIEDGLALLDSGPAVGTAVVVVGGAELGGVEGGL